MPNMATARTCLDSESARMPNMATALTCLGKTFSPHAIDGQTDQKLFMYVGSLATASAWESNPRASRSASAAWFCGAVPQITGWEGGQVCGAVPQITGLEGGHRCAVLCRVCV
jgi:hypothetical protein